jgi:hypothetical protein
MQVIQMATACWMSRLIFVAAQLGLADRLADGPQNAEAVAASTGSHAPSLYRVMRTLASLGLLMEDDQHRFALTPLGETLKTGAPGSARATVLTLAGDLIWRGYEELPYSVKTGKSGLEKAIGMPLFDRLATRPEEAALFSETMVGFHNMEPPAVAEGYDFSGIRTLADVGGATGHMLTAVLGRHQQLRGILFDLPHVVRDAPAFIGARGLTDRIEIKSGSFFDGVPEGADAYLMSHIIHDWTEELCLKILGNCRKAMGPGGRLLLVEMVLPTGDTPHPGKMLDIMMLVGPGGQERTAEEYRALLDKAGFRMTRVVPTASAVSVVEAVPA